MKCWFPILEVCSMQHETIASFLKLQINTQKYVKLDDATDNLISTLTKICQRNSLEIAVLWNLIQSQ